MDWFSKDGLPRPDEFPLGSPESRAAARAELERRHRVDVQIVIDAPRPHGHEGNSYRYKGNDGRVVEVVVRNSRLKDVSGDLESP